MDLSAPGYENGQLRFEPLSEAHADVLLNSDIEDAVWKWMPALPQGTSLRKYFDFILKAHSCGAAVFYVLFRKTDGEFVGITGFNEINKIHRRIRNMVAWHPPHLTSLELYQAGQHGMMERAYAWRAKRMEWQVNPENSYLMDHVTSLEPTREAYFRNFERTADGIWVDKVVFSMTRPELADAIRTLETRLFV